MPKPREFEDVMLDLETLGTRPGCSVMSIGAVAFGPGAVAEEGFYEVVGRASCLAHGLTEDADTLAWWARQDADARVLLEQAASTDALPLPEALAAFDAYLTRVCGPGVRVWANGAAFDNPILAVAYAAAGIDLPWRYQNDRCYRTLRALVPAVPQPEFAGVRHNALADARHQAVHAAAILAARRDAGG